MNEGETVPVNLRNVKHNIPAQQLLPKRKVPKEGGISVKKEFTSTGTTKRFLYQWM